MSKDNEMLEMLRHVSGRFSVSISGGVDIGFDHLEEAYNILVNTGYNSLDDLFDIKQLGLSSVDEYFTEEQRDAIDYLFSKDCYWDHTELLSSSSIRIIEKVYKLSLELDIKYQSKQNIRRVANLYISKKEVRRAVFNHCGYACVFCGGFDRISLDHIIPVSKGGKNEISNLQPACRSCNSIKGDRITNDIVEKKTTMEVD